MPGSVGAGAALAEEVRMLLLIAGAILALWLVGLLAHVAGAAIHVLLLIGVVVLVVHFVQNRSRV